MLRLGVAVLAFISLVQCWPASEEHGLLLERLRRSPHYCGPDYPSPAWPAPPPPPPPPPPPVFPPMPPPPFWPGHHHHHRYDWGESQRYQQQNDENFDSQNNGPPCDKCNGKTNTAVSNAESESGNAVAIAISRSKPNK